MTTEPDRLAVDGSLRDSDIARLFDNAPACVAARSGIAGWGLFAREPIPAGSTIIDFGDTAIYREANVAELDERDLRGGKFTALTPELCVTTDRLTKYALLNHSRTPNAITDLARRVVRAARDIAAGEEVTVDYRAEPLPERARQFCEDWL